MKKIFTILSAVLLCLTASAQEPNVKLADVIKNAIATSTEPVVPVLLDNHKVYELDSYVDLGKKDVIIWGGKALIVVTGEGQIATSAFLEIRNAKFDCKNAEAPIVGLSKEPDASLKINDEGSAIKFEGANQKVFWNDQKVHINGCVFSGLKQSLVYANKQPWALNMLILIDNVIQLEGDKIDPLINWVDSNTGGIMNIMLSKNLIYNISANNESSWFIRYGNASNAQPQKIWGSDAIARFIMYRNTIAFPGKAFANNFPNKNNVNLNWTENVFINTPYLQKTASNANRKFTNEDNIIYFNNGKTADKTDLEKYGMEDERVEFTVPTETLDLDAVSTLEQNFLPVIKSFTAAKQYGALVYPFKDNVAKTPGCGFELVLGPDMLKQYAIVGNCNESDLGKMKPGIDVETFPWIEYVRDDNKNILENGQNEAQQSNRWTDLNPTTGAKGEWLQVTGKNGSVNSPVVGKNVGKSLVLYVKDIAAIEVFATGSASGSAEDLNTIMITAEGFLPEYGATYDAQAWGTPGAIWGKGKASESVKLDDLDEGAYKVTISSVNKEIQILGIRLYSLDETPFPECHAPGEKYPGTSYEVVLGPDMLSEYALVDNPETKKPGINVEEYPWISYVRGDGLNALENGQFEAQKSNRWTDLNPVTGERGTWIQATGKNGSVNSPVISAEWNKWMEANIMETTKFRVYATGSASTTEATGDHLILTATANDGSVVTASTTPGTIWGKGKASDVAELTLDPTKAYVVKIQSAVKDIQITGFNLQGVDTTVAPAEENPAIGDPTGIDNVETSVAAPTKVLVNGRVMIVKGNNVYNVAGAQEK